MRSLVVYICLYSCFFFGYIAFRRMRSSSAFWAWSRSSYSSLNAASRTSRSYFSSISCLHCSCSSVQIYFFISISSTFWPKLPKKESLTPSIATTTSCIFLRLKSVPISCIFLISSFLRVIFVVRKWSGLLVASTSQPLMLNSFNGLPPKEGCCCDENTVVPRRLSLSELMCFCCWLRNLSLNYWRLSTESMDSTSRVVLSKIISPSLMRERCSISSIWRLSY